MLKEKLRKKEGKGLEKRKVFTWIAWILGALFLSSVIAVGAETSWFGFQDLVNGKGTLWTYRYSTTWDPEEVSVEGLSVSWNHGPVEIVASGTSMVKVTEYSPRTLNASEKLKLSSSNGVLRVQWDRSLLPLGILQDRVKRLVIEVPNTVAAQLLSFSAKSISGDVTVKGINAQTLRVDSTAGDVTLSNLTGEELRVSSGGGDIQLDGARANLLDVSTSGGVTELSRIAAVECRLSNLSGKVRFSGTGTDLQVKTVSGPVELHFSECPQQAEFQSVSGNLSLYLPENSGFEAQYSSVSGQFSSEFPGQGEQGLVYGHGGPQYQFVTTSGNLSLHRAAGAQTAQETIS